MTFRFIFVDHGDPTGEKSGLAVFNATIKQVFPLNFFGAGSLRVLLGKIFVEFSRKKIFPHDNRRGP